MGRGLGMVTFACGAGPLLGPVGKGRGSTWKGGPLALGVPKFGDRALSEGVWVGFRPRALEGGLLV